MTPTQETAIKAWSKLLPGWKVVRLQCAYCSSHDKDVDTLEITDDVPVSAIHGWYARHDECRDYVKPRPYWCD